MYSFILASLTTIISVTGCTVGPLHKVRLFVLIDKKNKNLPYLRLE